MTDKHDGYIIPPGPAKVAEPSGSTVDPFHDPPKEKPASRTAQRSKHDRTDFAERRVFD